MILLICFPVVFRLPPSSNKGSRAAEIERPRHHCVTSSWDRARPSVNTWWPNESCRVQRRQTPNSSLFSLWELSWAGSSFGFPGLLFPSCHIGIQAHVPCHWSPNRRTSYWVSPCLLTFLTLCPAQFCPWPVDVFSSLWIHPKCSQPYVPYALLRTHVVPGPSWMFCLHSPSPLLLAYFIWSIRYVII